ncbi:alpha/beta fold hydrolase [Curtobacterium sp. Curtsp57]|uniref:alpha/beta fold hydrolase n=1 Tax=Curtobacterium sp. Curtsp57 TaxID=3243047 RepID=UPI0039B50FE6
MTSNPSIVETRIATNGTRLNVATAGTGSPVLLMHGFPHTWRVWSDVIPVLSRSHRVIAPDLRGLGGSDRERTGYDARNLAADMAGLLDAMDAPTAAVVAIDAGVAPAFMLALEHPDRVSRLVLMESTIGLLPGAEGFFQNGAPWWFGFHAVPGLAETVVEGHEAEYLDFFLRSGTADQSGVAATIGDAFVSAYRGREALRCGFEYYRAMPRNAEQIAEATTRLRLRVPTLAVGAQVVGDATARQLEPITDQLESASIPTSGHIVPLDRPRELLDRLSPFLSDTLPAS